MARYGLFDAGETEPREVYSAYCMKSEGGTLLLYSSEAPLCVTAAICLKEGQRLQELSDTSAGA